MPPPARSSKLPSFSPGPLTPLLVEGKGTPLQPALRGALGDGVEGVVGQLAYTRNKTFRFQVALTQVPAATAFAPRVFCGRRGRSTRDDEFYGFEARHSKLWTESAVLKRREIMPVFAASRMEPGLVLPAYANPEDPDDFVLVW